MKKKNPSLTSSYKPPKSAKKIPDGDSGVKLVDKAFKQSNEAETSSYMPPQSPIAIQPGDKGFEIVGKAYNKWLWTFPEWKKKSSKIINPNANWGLNAKPMTPSEMKKKMKNLYLIDYLTRQLVDGVFVEMEHTDSPQKAREIAIDHLYEDPNYYIKLKKIE